jgi:hypothetical protein
VKRVPAWICFNSGYLFKHELYALTPLPSPVLKNGRGEGCINIKKYFPGKTLSLIHT